MSWPEWIPYIGVLRLSRDQQYEMGLDPDFDWSGFGAEWFGYGYCLFVFAKVAAS